MTVSKIIDRNGRLFGKVSFIDVLVVLVVAVMAIALYVKNNTLEASMTGETSSTPIVFTVEAENVHLNVIEAIQVGDKVYDKDRSSGGTIGVITAIEEMEAGKVERLTDGTYARLTNEHARNLIITIEGSGSVNNGRYAINKIYEIGVNAARNFYTSHAVFTASVIDIQ